MNSLVALNQNAYGLRCQTRTKQENSSNNDFRTIPRNTAVLALGYSKQSYSRDLDLGVSPDNLFWKLHRFESAMKLSKMRTVKAIVSEGPHTNHILPPPTKLAGETK